MNQRGSGLSEMLTALRKKKELGTSIAQTYRYVNDTRKGTANLKQECPEKNLTMIKVNMIRDGLRVTKNLVVRLVQDYYPKDRLFRTVTYYTDRDPKHVLDDIIANFDTVIAEYDRIWQSIVACQDETESMVRAEQAKKELYQKLGNTQLYKDNSMHVVFQGLFGVGLQMSTQVNDPNIPPNLGGASTKKKVVLQGGSREYVVRTDEQGKKYIRKNKQNVYLERLTKGSWKML